MAVEQRSRELAEQYTQVVTRAWHDEGFKRRLVAEPQVVLQEHDLPVPDGKTVRVVENTADTMYLVLPTRPAGERAAEQLNHVAGEQQEQAEKYAQLVTTALHDEAFKQRLVADPRTVLQEQGLPLPAGKTVRVVENTADTVHLILPPKPAEGELSDEQLDQVAGGLLAETAIFLGTVGVYTSIGAGIVGGVMEVADWVSGWFD